MNKCTINQTWSSSDLSILILNKICSFGVQLQRQLFEIIETLSLLLKVSSTAAQYEKSKSKVAALSPGSLFTNGSSALKGILRQKIYFASNHVFWVGESGVYVIWLPKYPLKLTWAVISVQPLVIYFHWVRHKKIQMRKWKNTNTKGGKYKSKVAPSLSPEMARRLLRWDLLAATGRAATHRSDSDPSQIIITLSSCHCHFVTLSFYRPNTYHNHIVMISGEKGIHVILKYCKNCDCCSLFINVHSFHFRAQSSYITFTF